MLRRRLLRGPVVAIVLLLAIGPLMLSAAQAASVPTIYPGRSYTFATAFSCSTTSKLAPFYDNRCDTTGNSVGAYAEAVLLVSSSTSGAKVWQTVEVGATGDFKVTMYGHYSTRALAATLGYGEVQVFFEVYDASTGVMIEKDLLVDNAVAGLGDSTKAANFQDWIAFTGEATHQYWFALEIASNAKGIPGYSAVSFGDGMFSGNGAYYTSITVAPVPVSGGGGGGCGSASARCI